jgi:hypothetical protein
VRPCGCTVAIGDLDLGKALQAAGRHDGHPERLVAGDRTGAEFASLLNATIERR